MGLTMDISVSQWNSQTGAFFITFSAEDDNGQPCTNKQFSIQYGMKSDGTNPDVLQLLRVYSDASGLVKIKITEPCVITVYARYLHDITNPDLGENVEEVAYNLHINFVPFVTELNASYPENSPVEYTDLYDINKLIVQATMSDGSIKIIPASDCILNDLQILYVGVNTRKVKYYDSVMNVTWETEFTVIGIRKLISINAIYHGEQKVIGDTVFPEEIILTVKYLDETGEVIAHPEYGEWLFLTPPIITQTNTGILYIQYNGTAISITVPYDGSPTLKLRAWYEGYNIEVGKKYDRENVILILEYKNGNTIRLKPKQVTFSSTLVSKEGWNWFTVTYTTNYITLTRQFPVLGIIHKTHVDLDFKVLYISNDEEIDMTKEFQELMMIDGMLYISWYLFSDYVNETRRYGLYKMTVPKLCGCSNEYCTEWAVLCLKATTLKATITKIYE